LEKTKGKQTLDLLDLPQKERIRLCKEIRSLLRQKIVEEKAPQRETPTAPEEPHRTMKSLSKVSEQSLVKIENCRTWNGPA
jgi:hypothetical protein